MSKTNYSRFNFLSKLLLILILFVAVALYTVSIGKAGHHGESSNTTDAASTLVSFEKLFGVTQGKRRNHTKGFCFDGVLVPADKSIQTLTTSALFTEESKVVGRLSHKGGNNNAADDSPADYGLGLSIMTTGGSTHLMSMNTLDFFPVATPEAFAALMHAKAQGGDAVKKFKASNVDLQRFKAHAAKKPKTLTSYEGASYNSINSFYLVDTHGAKTAIRWSFEPSKKQALVVEPSENFFYKNLQKNLATHEVAWNMVVTIANPDDDINNPALAWKGEHKEITAAKLIINDVSTEQEGKCDVINFDPMVLASGFEPSDDPLLQARRNIYAISFAKRVSEKN